MKGTLVPRAAGIFVAAAVLGLLVVRAQGDGEQPKGPTAGQSFKNVQALKDLPADQLMPTMMSYNKALGTTCDHCHVMDDMSKDTKPAKVAARQMILMTQKVNQNEPSLHKKLTCYMCHRGEVEPSGSEEAAKAKATKKQGPKASDDGGEKKAAEPEKE
ncbi:MAG TPA: photosynthetic reaction center cytochrome c subunit family protein [Armatimonadota bacterium]|jgi:hypothetical protein